MSHHILIIDDDKMIAEIIQLTLKSDGYVSEVAYNATEGMEKAIADPPAVILMDYNMPGKDGFTLVREMRTIPALEKVPVVMVSALSIPDILTEADELGVASFMVKPFDLTTLLDHVRRAYPPGMSR